ncbi:hypothetical protein CKN73_00650 [Carnobacterium divergens]|uniref:LTA synthase family protein n=1 Tax=Carnobacterium divergens TaxID=2748 RepID=UPI0010729DFF|nr:LTA synthase family protein [Carnobacterium divergens]TFJ44987.1 hypothetical protein CKN77_00645 [Carnobacterium divergens]TFJ52056.1 hypothetical protein CKN73_00650 [Carnobacterium divergens]TFJ57633.1 hypothetical protein CKN83_00645 [Carnobacterium divergens]TFJ65648.1 hypothetical protein CKN89_00650 [Carnobacterium divergens]TFJ73953.1 hypothetical protein CKN91_00645 [Carnobacterium divergens]
MMVLVLPFFYLLLLQASQSGFDFKEAGQFFLENINIFFMSYVLILTLTLFVLSVTGSFIVTEFFSMILFAGLSFANNQKMIARNASIYPEDLSMIKELKLLVTMIDGDAAFKIIALILFLVLLCVGSLIFVKKSIKLKFNKKVYYFSRLGLLICSLTVLYLMSNINESDSIANNLQNKLEIEFVEWSQPENYKTNGFVLAFLNNSKVKAMEEPENYSKKEVNKIVAKYKNLATSMNQERENLSDVNIIYVMSESFIDPSDTDDFYSKSEDAIPFTHSIMEQNTYGRALVSDYGGGTANMEFEALTSFSNYFLQVIAYQSIVSKFDKFPSIVSYLKDSGYETTAIHPYDGNMYKRVEVYKSLGFDQFIDEATIKYDKRLFPEAAISDEAAFEEVLDVLNTDSKAKFIHLVTMQNHQPYGTLYDEQKIEVYPDDDLTEDIRVRMEIYLQGLRYSDEALEKFIDSLEKSNKKTMVVFWGDHYPGQGLFSNIDDEYFQLTHSTPTFIYSNFEKEEESLGTQSLNYLGANVLNQVNAKVTPFYAMLLKLNSEIKGLTKGVQLDKDSAEISNFNEENYPTLKEYEMIQYDLISGNKYSMKEKFYSLEN